MKQLFNFRTLNVTIVFQLIYCAVFGQSFQNTILPLHDERYAAGVAVNKNYWVIGTTSSFTPSVGTEHILFSKYNGMTGAKIWDRKYYDGAVPVIQFTATDIQAGYSTHDEAPGNSNPPLPCNFNACPVPGTVVHAVSAPNSQSYFYVSGFYFDPAFNVRRLLVMKLSNTGAIIWSRTNVLGGGPIFDEAGISVESCPNGDVIAVSEIFNGTIFYPAVTRIDMAGNLLWRFHYPPAVNEQPYNLIPHQSCLFKEVIPNGNLTPTGIAITGECSNPAVANTSSFFVMRIAYNGLMIYKNNYPLVLPTVSRETGWDIMPEAEILGNAALVDNFIVTGLSNAVGVGPVPGALGFAARVTTMNGAFVNCYRFGTGVPATQWTYGQGIYQSGSSSSNVVITGGTENQPNGIFADTYLYEMSITTGFQVSGHNYPLTTPDISNTESVVAVGGAFPTKGFFISTNSVNTYGGATLDDGHVIKTDIYGGVNNVTCLSDTLVFSHDSVNVNVITHCTGQQCFLINPIQLVMKKVNAPHQLCFSANKFAETEVSSDSGHDMMVFPNPSAGDEISVSCTVAETGEYLIRIMNMNGEIKEEVSENLLAGANEISLRTDQLHDGLYLIQLSNGSYSRLTKFIKMTK